MYRVLEAKGELRLNDFLYDNVDCGRLWELGGQQGRRRTPVAQDDARRDPRWGWVPSSVPFGFGRVKMQVRDIMGNVWSTHYVNGMFPFRHFDREAAVEEKEAMRCRSRDARISDPPLSNPVELAFAEGKVFTGEKRITYVHVMGKEATFDGICMDFLVVVTRISVCNPHVRDRRLLEEHAQRCWEKIREEDRQMVCMGYDDHNDRAMWFIVEDVCTDQPRPSTNNLLLEGIRRRYGCTSPLGVMHELSSGSPPVCCMSLGLAAVWPITGLIVETVRCWLILYALFTACVYAVEVALMWSRHFAQEEDEEENCAEEMSEEVEHERMQERGEGDNSDRHHDVDAEESDPEGEEAAGEDKSEEGGEAEKGNSEGEEREITSAENSAQCGTDEKKGGAPETSSNDKQIVERENVPLQEKAVALYRAGLPLYGGETPII
ncbi:hypothetical protein CBR_g41006 [Chara braunii]|uniref:Uncharacterized protein n=1 Tax=Chara braunii TaxID=69332 RepID=A0A388LV40_CHABU|nr:hypothetical protein CBR_g41006 [Chara braunii]|eukprot:GBG86103.1 hypothetical protein CBR_g41006 [Chara braunii]